MVAWFSRSVRKNGAMQRRFERLRGRMDTELDYDLTPDQWETLKALRIPATGRHGLSRSIVDHLVALELATYSDEQPRITVKGRSVLLRGSPRLLDLAA
jgi:hypothetical protein